jgi:hypothetical protein
MVGRKTHEQQLRALERKPDIPDGRQMEAQPRSDDEPYSKLAGSERAAEFPVSRAGMNQESRDHNKHNDRGQQGHKPQLHRPAEEKS